MNNAKILICLLCLLVMQICRAEKTSVVIINSSRKISRYMENEKAFREKMGHEEIEPTIYLDKKMNNSVTKVVGKLHDIYPDYVYCIGLRAYLVARKALPEKVIVFSSVIDAKGLELTDKSYGIAMQVHPSMMATYLSLIFPEMRDIKAFSKEAQTKAPIVGNELELSYIPMGKRPLKKVKKSQMANFYLTPIKGLFKDKESLINLFEDCLANKLPIISYNPEFMFHDAVICSIYINEKTIAEQSAILLKSLIAKDENIEQLTYPAGSNISINLEACEKMKVKVDKSFIRSVGAKIISADE